MIVKNLIAALREDDTVYVNDLGLFRKVFTRAHVEEKQVFPPRYSVLLDAEEEGSGYAFILFVSKAENIRIVDADLAIRRWVETLTEELHKGRNVTVEGFGTFSMKKNKLEFTASPEIPELNAEFEGLEPIDIQKYPKQKHPERTEILPPADPEPISETEPVAEPITESEPVVETEPITESEPVVETEPVAEPEPIDVAEPISEPGTDTEPAAEPEPEAEPVVEPEPITESEPEAETEQEEETDQATAEASDTDAVQEEDEEKEKEEEEEDEADSKPKRHRGWIVFVVVLLAAIGVLGWFFQDNLLDLYHQKFDNQPVVDDTTAVVTMPVEEAVEIDTLAGTDSLEVTDGEYAEPELEVKPFDINHLEHISYESGKYYLVHGSFSQEADCARHIRSHHFEAYSPTVLHQSGNARLRVCLGVFSSEEAAMQFAASNGIKDAWTLK